MRPKGSPEAPEMRRKNAVNLLNDGFGVREVARFFDVSPGAVSDWKQAHETDGEAGLAAKPQTGGGRPPFLSYEQYPHLEELLLEGPQAHGFETDLWTLARVGVVIEREFGVSYSEAGVRKVLKRTGWSYQRPQSYTQKRDEEAVAYFPTYAPDLNPSEQLWTHVKYGQMGNSVPETIDHLHRRAGRLLAEKQPQQETLRNYIGTAKLAIRVFDSDSHRPMKWGSGITCQICHCEKLVNLSVS